MPISSSFFRKLCAGKVKRFSLVSAMEANSKTGDMYLQVKRLEEELLKLNLGTHRFYRPISFSL